MRTKQTIGGALAMLALMAAAIGVADIGLPAIRGTASNQTQGVTIKVINSMESSLGDNAAHGVPATERWRVRTYLRSHIATIEGFDGYLIRKEITPCFELIASPKSIPTILALKR